MKLGVHGEKIRAAINSGKIPDKDKQRLQIALEKYQAWISNLVKAEAKTAEGLVTKLVDLLNEYKFYIDVDVIFDSDSDFLYRQKGQLKLDNTIMEEFLPILVKRYLEKQFGACNVNIGAQIQTFSAMHFTSTLTHPEIGGGVKIHSKDQDFAISRPLFIKASYKNDFEAEATVKLETHIGYVLAEVKTQLDKTMFQEASATAHDVKRSVAGAKYFLLCDFLDMPPISTRATEIDGILILRKAKRLNANIRKNYSTYTGRQKGRQEYVDRLKKHPYSAEVLMHFLKEIEALMQNETLTETEVLSRGFF